MTWTGLVPVAHYRTVTGDTTTADSVVQDRIDEAVTFLDDELDRFLTSAERTETLLIHPDRRAYPKAWPVTVATGWTIDPIMGGRALRDVSPDDRTFGLDFDLEGDPPTATVTYTGGYAPYGTGGDNDLPATLARCVAQLAQALGVPVSVGAPAGATSISLGDASVTFANPVEGLDELVPGITARLRPFYRREYR